MQLTSIISLLSATAVSVSALPGAFHTIQARQAAGSNNTTGPKDANFACDTAYKVVTQQIAEMSKLKAQDIPIPGYLSGYYTAINSGRQEIGCPGAITVGKRQFVPSRKPCDVLNEQHERMMVLVNRFEADHIGVAPFIAGFLSATLDGHKGLGCPPLTGPATEVAAAKIVNASNSTAKSSS
ncbi:MAG: hypothetical protein Q9161_005798 [Pseudevernia consocians]